MPEKVNWRFCQEFALNRMDHDEYLALRQGCKVLEADPYGDKVLRLSDGSIFKMFRRKRFFSSTALYPYAWRFAHNAEILAKFGISVPRIIRVVRIPEISRDAVQYVPLAGKTLREMVRSGLSGERKSELKKQFTDLVIRLHDHGVYFRSLHLGNVVCSPEGQLGLIDFSDLRIFPWKLGRYLRKRNLKRMQGIADEVDWLDLEALLNLRNGGVTSGAGVSK